MSTVRDLISSSMRLLGAIAQGESIEAAEGADALSSLNSLIDGWNTESLTVPSVTRETFDLIPGKFDYTVGPEVTPPPSTPTVDFETTRILKLENAAIEYQGSSTFELPLQILEDSEWAQIQTRSLSGDPRKIRFGRGTEVDVLSLWPVPDKTLKLALYALKPLTKFLSLNDVLKLPLGYEQALRYNLAVALAPEYGKDPSALVMQTAIDSKANIKRQNLRTPLMQSDSALTGGKRFDIRTGD